MPPGTSTLPVIWKIADNKAQRVPVRIMQRNAAYVLVNAEIKPGDRIVAEGVQAVRQGGTVQIKGQPANQTDSGARPLASVGEKG